ncbi:hypothetical protein B4Q13_16315, partial [Lacticaseibacillus rhamnosus]
NQETEVRRQKSEASLRRSELDAQRLPALCLVLADRVWGTARIGVLTVPQASLVAGRRGHSPWPGSALAGVRGPFICGCALGQYLPDAVLPNAGQRLVTSLFLGTALSISSIQIVAALVRELDDVAFKLQRSGRMGTYPPNKGSEAATLGAAAALTRGVDQLIGYYRENAAYYWHGLPMHLMYLHWLGDERGNAIPRELNLTPMCIEIGAQVLHAAGFAWSKPAPPRSRRNNGMSTNYEFSMPIMSCRVLLNGACNPIRIRGACNWPSTTPEQLDGEAGKCCVPA